MAPSQHMPSETCPPCCKTIAKTTRAIILAIILAALILIWMHEPEDLTLRFTGSTMGTTYSVTCVLDRKANENDTFKTQLADKIASCLEQVNGMMSTYKPDSELSRLNQHADNTPFPVSPPLLHVLSRAIEISQQTDGAFDVTVGPIVNAYGFGPPDKPLILPTETELEQLKQRVGYRMITVDKDKNTVTKSRPDLYIDLSAIAKGYAVDRAAAVLDEQGMTNYLVEIGGEVRVRGYKRDGGCWRIGVEKPAAHGRTVECVLPLTDIAMATSGDYRNYYVKDGMRISHTIDPRTAHPVAHPLASVTVLDQDCETADALATALMVLGPDDGYNLAKTREIAALFLIRQADDTYTEKRTAGFVSATSAPNPQETKPESE